MIEPTLGLSEEQGDLAEMTMHKQATPDHPVHELIARRWSPYAFTDQPVSDDALRSLFEAARWAASSYNEQPWSYIVATKANTEEFERMLSCLVEGNQPWAKAAPVLALGCTRLHFVRNGKPNAAAVHDLGLASATLTLEATARGLFVHQMIGIVPDRVRELYHVPDGVQPLTGLAIGYAADPNILAEPYRQRDLAPRQRKPLAEFVFGGQWGTPSPVITQGTTQRFPQTATITKSGEGRTLAVVGDLYTFLATGKDTDGRYAMWDAAVFPGGGPPPHFHTREVEAFFVLEGQVTFQVSGELHVAGPGTLLNVPTGVVHAFRNETQQPARMLIWVTPAGLEKMFEEIGQPVTSQNAVPPPVTKADIDQILAVAPKYGVHIKLPT